MARALEKYLRPGVKGTPFCPGCGHGILMNHILRMQPINNTCINISREKFLLKIFGNWYLNRNNDWGII